MRKILAAVALVLLVSCGQGALKPAARQPSAKPFSPPPGWALFVSGDQSIQDAGSRAHLDAATLKDAGSPVAASQWEVVSADGSTLVDIDYSPNADSAIKIIDARTGSIRTSFRSSIASGPSLTPDGSQLLVFNNTGHSYRVFDTSDGYLTGRLETSDTPCCDLFNAWIDPTGGFLYGILVPGSGWNATGPVTPILVRYDLHAGRENARLKLSGITAGVWRNGTTVAGEQGTTVLQPGAALSPDGSQLAMLYDDGRRLMTIDTIAMKVATDRPIVVPPTTMSLSAFGPVEVDAKSEVGTIWDLTYSPDGHYLVASKHEMTIDPKTNVSTSHGMGARLIDVQTATVTADRPGLDIDDVTFAPDSTAIFATRWYDDNAGQHRTTLVRLDPSNLATAAQRDFSGSHWILLLASSADDRAHCRALDSPARRSVAR